MGTWWHGARKLVAKLLDYNICSPNYKYMLTMASICVKVQKFKTCKCHCRVITCDHLWMLFTAYIVTIYSIYKIFVLQMNESTTQQKWINGNGLRQAPVRAAHISIYSLISVLHAISAHLSAIRAWPYWARLYLILINEERMEEILTEL